MKTNYQTPQIEVIEMRNLLENFCTSGTDFSGKSGSYDPDSD